MLAKGYTDQPPTQSGFGSALLPSHGDGISASDTRWDYLVRYPRVVRALIGQSPLRHAPSWIQDWGLVAAHLTGGRAHDEVARGAGGAVPQFVWARRIGLLPPTSAQRTGGTAPACSTVHFA